MLQILSVLLFSVVLRTTLDSPPTNNVYTTCISLWEQSDCNLYHYRQEVQVRLLHQKVASTTTGDSLGSVGGDQIRGSTESGQATELCDSSQCGPSVVETRRHEPPSSFTKLSMAVTNWVTGSQVDCDQQAKPLGDGSGQCSVVFLPAVHSVTGNQLQWNIFSRQLALSLTGVCADLEVNASHAQESLTGFTRHFQ